MAVEGFKQYIQDWTRSTATTNSIIDHCYTNISEERLTTKVLNTGITDHFTTYIAAERDETVEQRRERRREELASQERTFKRYDYCKIKREISERDWKEKLEGRNGTESMDILQKNIQEIMKKNTIIKKQSNHYSKGNEKWINREII